MDGNLRDRLPDGAYLHRAQELTCVPGLEREHAWQRLSEEAQRELTSRAGGEIIDWVAGRAGDAGDASAWAVVLGHAGLHLALPGASERTWTYSGWRFQPDSLTTLTRTITAQTASARVGYHPEGEDPLLARSLEPEFRGFLGHLPGDVQVLIQQPFHPGTDLIAFRWYLGNIEIVKETWRFWCYLTDNATLVFASGSRLRNPSAKRELMWNVNYHRAAVA
jgi:hypothetical protein